MSHMHFMECMKKRIPYGILLEDVRQSRTKANQPLSLNKTKTFPFLIWMFKCLNIGLRFKQKNPCFK